MSGEMPSNVVLKDVSAWINHNTIPRTLQNFTVMEAEHWGRVTVDHGEVYMNLEGGGQPQRITPEEPGIIPPAAKYKFGGSGQPGRFQILFYHEPPLADGEALAGLLSKGAKSRTKQQGAKEA